MYVCRFKNPPPFLYSKCTCQSRLIIKNYYRLLRLKWTYPEINIFQEPITDESKEIIISLDETVFLLKKRNCTKNFMTVATFICFIDFVGNAGRQIKDYFKFPLNFVKRLKLPIMNRILNLLFNTFLSVTFCQHFCNLHTYVSNSHMTSLTRYF